MRVRAMSDKTRLDAAIFARGLCESREKAKALVMAGCVYINGIKELKPGTPVKQTDELTVRDSSLKYVSRGGLKLEKAIKCFPIHLRDAVCIDVGASTGGFTDCMLQNDAAKVYSVDVGYGQLSWRLRNDARVVNLERTNFRYITSEQIPDKADFASVDVSFISLKHILPALFPLLKATGSAVCLIKPQFEAGREFVGKNGVVREREVHVSVIEQVLGYARQTGFYINGLDYSPVKGPQGNIEYLMYIGMAQDDAGFLPDSRAVVAASHEELD